MYQTVIVAGNVGKDAEMRYTPSGAAVASFSVATNNNYTKSDGSNEKQTVWFRVSTWGKLADVCNQYVKKGNLVLVEGRLEADTNGGPRVWTAKDGTNRSSFEVNASVVRFLSQRQEAAQDSLPPSDEIPF